jgi:Domain of unknown function (DUF5666)
MNRTQKSIVVLTLGAAAILPGSFAAGGARGDGGQAQQPATPAPSRVVGVITAISGNSITLKTDAGAPATIVVDAETRMLQAAPGQKDLSSAAAIQIQDLAVGDRILARVKTTEDGKLEASTVIAMKQTDIAAKQAKDRQDWQRRGVGGLVRSVDSSSHSVLIAAAEPGGSKPINVHVLPATVVRRYSPDSIKFDDAKMGTLDQIRPGDQLRARGDRSADGSDLNADEIISGTFHNVAATVILADPAAGSLTVNDLATKKPVVIRITSDSQLRRLPAMMAQGIAMRLKGAAGGAAPTSNGTAGAASPGSNGANGGTVSGGPESSSSGHDPRANQPRGTEGTQPRTGGDMQQMLARAPEIQLAELKKGDAVMVVATEGSDSTPATAITLLAGVEPMLQASTSASQSMLMASWNLNANGGQDAQQ